MARIGQPSLMVPPDSARIIEHEPRNGVANGSSRKPVVRKDRPDGKRSVPASRRALVEDVVSRIIRVIRPEKIFLFGSAARGQAGKDSDLDFMVVVPGDVHRRSLARTIYSNLIGITVPVDVIVVTHDDVENMRGTTGNVIGPALREGIEVYAG